MNQQHQRLSENQGAVNGRELPQSDPYSELMARQLVKVLQHLGHLVRSSGGYIRLPLPDGWYRFPPEWAADGFLPLDDSGRDYLRGLGLRGADLRDAINAGVRSGLIKRKVRGGVACIAHAESERAA